jgi:hypothetical protein
MAETFLHKFFGLWPLVFGCEVSLIGGVVGNGNKVRRVGIYLLRRV